MNFYLYTVTIFDTAPDADLTVFPKIEPWTTIAENENEAQRQIVEQLYTPNLGTCWAHSTEEDAADRFHIVFGEPKEVAEVVWNPDLNEGTGAWDWA